MLAELPNTTLSPALQAAIDEAVGGFDELDIVPSVLRAVHDLGYTEPTPIQSMVIPLMVEGRDVVGQSQTGTGKTAAFGIPIVSSIDPYLADPEFRRVNPQLATVDLIDQTYCEVLEDDKLRAMRRLLREQEKDTQLLVFRRTQRGVDWLVRRLQDNGFRVEGIHGAM